MFRLVCTLILILQAAFAGHVLAQYQPVSTASAPVKIFPLSELKEGMRGTARSVFRGSKPEQFTVEILGLMPNSIGPKQDMIVGKLIGVNTDRTFVFAGMSGSPVYIDGKLVGAISYSFAFAKEPICGITPFGQMVADVERAPIAKVGSSTLKTFTYDELMSNAWTPALGSARNAGAMASGFSANSRMMEVAGQTFRPIATPVTFSGIPQSVVDSLAPSMREAGMLPVMAASSDSKISGLKAATETTLLGGDSVVVALARGDVQIFAAGTVTMRDGNKIYAFGHPFFGLGSTSLPMSESHVVTVVPNAANSFKLSVADSMVGTLTQDRNTGIYGLLGQAPKMLPVKIRLGSSRGKFLETNFETVIDETLTPLILNAGVAGALSANERTFGEMTIELNAEVAVKGTSPLRIKRRFVGVQAMPFAASTTSIPISALLRAKFEDLDITGITIDLTAVDGSTSGVLDRVSVDRNRVRAGETIEVTAFERAASGAIVPRKVSITVPQDVSPGPMSVVVGDGNALQQGGSATQYTPRSAADFVAMYNRLRRPDRLYAVLTRGTTGAVIGTSEMPSLPPSMLATLNNDRTSGGTKPVITTILAETELPISRYVVTGIHTVSIEIVR